MKKYFSLIILFSFTLLEPVIACTTFLINKNGELVFGRNYDWLTGAGMLCSNSRGMDKISVKKQDGPTIHWVSKYGSITFNQYGKEFPTGGMNEKGLVVELMWLDGTVYPKEDSRPALTVLQWIQFQLDNHASVEEVIGSDEKLRISINNVPLHYLVADANGNAATIEFQDGKMLVHTGNDLPFPVLTNNTYKESVQAAVKAGITSGNTNFNFTDNSLQRFAKTCSMVQQFQKNEMNKSAINYAFDILGQVAQGNFTKWSIVYDIRHKKIYFRTAGYYDIKSLGFDSFDFNCGSGSRAMDINQSLKGDISASFKPFTMELNRTIVGKAVEESKSKVEITDQQKATLTEYPATVKCKE